MNHAIRYLLIAASAVVIQGCDKKPAESPRPPEPKATKAPTQSAMDTMYAKLIVGEFYSGVSSISVVPPKTEAPKPKTGYSRTLRIEWSPKEEGDQVRWVEGILWASHDYRFTWKPIEASAKFVELYPNVLDREVVLPISSAHK
jgi:hypothetical protein